MIFSSSVSNSFINDKCDFKLSFHRNACMLTFSDLNFKFLHNVRYDNEKKTPDLPILNDKLTEKFLILRADFHISCYTSLFFLPYIFSYFILSCTGDL